MAGARKLCPPGAASSVADRACAAAATGKADECLKLTWALRDLPRDQAVKDTLNVPRGEPAKTLLQAVAAAGFEEPTKLLLELAAPVWPKDREGQTALHHACSGNHASVAQLLLSRGHANANARNELGQTPLHIAVNLGHGRVSRVLMRFGADPTATDCNGMTPLALAEANPDNGIGPWLQQFVAKRQRTSANVGKIRSFKSLDTELPAHIVAPKLVLTSVGYCPFEDGEVKQLARGIRCNKRRQGPSGRNLKVNWYSPRG